MEKDGHKLNMGLKEEGTRTPVGIHFLYYSSERNSLLLWVDSYCEGHQPCLLSPKVSGTCDPLVKLPLWAHIIRKVLFWPLCSLTTCFWNSQPAWTYLACGGEVKHGQGHIIQTINGSHALSTGRVLNKFFNSLGLTENSMGSNFQPFVLLVTLSSQ